MFKAFDFCLPTRGIRVPDRPEWLHEVKYDGYRLRVERDGDRVRLFFRNGNDWRGRYPWIVEAALKNKHDQFVIDGDAVVLGVDGIADSFPSGDYADRRPSPPSTPNDRAA
jgi:ATP-dependent DNA ligase